MRSAFLMGYRWLSPRERRRLLAATVALALVSLLDLLGVLLLAYVASLMMGMVRSSGGANVQHIPVLPVPNGTSALLVVAAFAAMTLAAKSLVSWRVNRRVLRFMALREVAFAQRLYVMYMTGEYPAAQSVPTQSVVAGILSGSRGLTLILASAVGLVAEITLIVSLSMLLLVSSPLLFAFTVVYFGAVAVGVSRLVGNRSLRASELAAWTGVQANQRVNETVGLARELRVYRLWRRFGEGMSRQQSASSLASAEQASWFQAPRYFLETALVVGLALAAGLVLWTQPPDRAVFSLGLYAVASSRLLPSVQRLNGAWGSAKAALGMLIVSEPILDLPPGETGSELDHSDSAQPLPLPGCSGLLRLEDVTFCYPSSSVPALDGVTVDVAMPSRIAIVGPSGSGKSTLADILLGILRPSKGQVTIQLNGHDARPVVPGYVPQDVYLSPGSVRENVALCLPGESADDRRVWAALRTAQVDDVVRSLPDGLGTRLGERGVRLSGGQRQRIGLARALFREPQILILDEATSALDADTEREVTDAIRAIPGDVTVVTIAHRLATIRDADMVLYLMEGRLVAADTFSNLTRAHPELARTAELQGLDIR